MVAIISGNGLGISNSSAGVLGAFGEAALGVAKEASYVNIATGNLSLADKDGFFATRGVDLTLTRTYNSRAASGSNWIFGPQRKLVITGTPGTANCTINLVDADGSIDRFVHKSGNLYESTDGPGGYQTLRFNAGGSWTWMSDRKDTQGYFEQFDGTGRLTSVADQAGTGLTYTYGDYTWGVRLLSSIRDAAGNISTFNYDSINNLQEIVTTGGGQTRRTIYNYDSSKRLTSVIQDLTPDDIDDQFAINNTYSTTYAYDGTSTRVSKIVQSDGTSLGFTYLAGTDGEVRISSVTDGLGRVTQYSYDLQARITTVTDPLSQRTAYRYDTSGNLLTVTELDQANARPANFTYDAEGNLLTREMGGIMTTYEYQNGNCVSETDSAGKTITRQYHPVSNKLLRESVSFVGSSDTPLVTRYIYDSLNRLCYLVSAQGRVTQYSYIGANVELANSRTFTASYSLTGVTADTLITLDQLNSFSSANRAMSSRIEYDYGAQGLATREKYYDNDTTIGFTEYTYNQAGQRLTAKDALGNTTTYWYDTIGRLTAVQDANNTSAITTYAFGKPLVVTTTANGVATSHHYDTSGQLIEVRKVDPAAGSTVLDSTRNHYDANGRLRMSQNGSMRSFWFYDAAGRKSAEVDGAGAMTEFIYNGAGQVIKSIRYANPVLTALTDSSGVPLQLSADNIRPSLSSADRAQWNAYDAAGRLVETVDGNGCVTRYEYDQASRIIRTVQLATQADTAALAGTSLDALASLRSFGVASATGDRAVRHFYDNDGLLVGKIDALGFLTEYVYNGKGQLIDTVGYSAPAKAPTTAKSLSEARPDVGVNDLHERRLYNARGQVVAIVDADNYVTALAYDTAGRLLTRTRYEKAATSPLATSLATFWGATGTPAVWRRNEYRYTKLNQLEREAVTSSEGGTTYTHYTYDSRGNVLTIGCDPIAAYADTRTFNTYDKLDQLVSTYRNAGIEAAPATVYTYDDSGLRTSATDPRGNKTWYYYDAAGRLTHTVNSLGEVREQSYNAFGQISATRQYANRIVTANLTGGTERSLLLARLGTGGLADQEVHYTFDNGGRLLMTVSGNHSTKQAYNAFNQVVSSSAGALRDERETARYEYDANGRILWRTDGLGQALGYAYDAFGRATASKVYLGLTASGTAPMGASDDTITTYDRRGNVLSLTDAEGNRIENVYNGYGELVTKARRAVPAAVGSTFAATDTVTRTLYDGNGRIIGTIDANGVLSTNKYDRAGRLIERITYSTPLSASAASTLTESRVYSVLKRSSTDRREMYFYDARGRQIASTRELSYSEWDEVDESGNTTFQKRIEWAYTAMTYDDNDRLIERRNYLNPFVDTNGNPSLTALQGWTNGYRHFNDSIERLVYDKAGRLTDTLTAQGTANQSLWALTSLTYDAFGNVLTRTSYAAPIKATTPTDADIAKVKEAPQESDVLISYQYDRLNRVIATATAQSVEGSGATAKRNWSITQREYDAAGNLHKERQFATFAVTSIGNSAPLDVLPSITLADRVTVRTYDAANRLKTVLVPGDLMTEMVYDTKGNVIETHAGERITRSVYDRAGRLVYSINPEGSVTKRDYDSLGNVAAVTRFATPSSLSATPATPTGLAITTNAAHDRVERYAYDSAGRQRFIIDAEGYVKETRYDALGQITESIAYASPPLLANTKLATIVQAVANKPGRTTKNEYNSAGQLTMVTDAAGRVEQHVYNALGQRTTLYNTAGTYWNYTYDAAGRLVQEITSPVSVYSGDALTEGYTLPAVPVSASLVTKMSYDAFGNLTSRSEGSAAANAPLRVTRYEYDAAGRQVRTVPPAFSVYDAAADSNVASRNERPSGEIDIRVSYDALGNAISNKDVGGNLSYKAYDKAGRVRFEIDAQGFVTGYERNAFGEVVQLTRFGTPLATSVERSIDAITNALAARSSAEKAEDRSIITTYDKLGRTETVRQPEVWVSDTANAGGSSGFLAAQTTRKRYNAFGDVIQQLVYGADRQGNALTEAASTRFYFDRRGLKRAQVQALRDGSVQEGYLTTFGYDDAGNLTEQNEFNASIRAWSDTVYNAATTDAGRDRTVTYGYDVLSRKTRETKSKAQADTGADIITVYEYDAVGNQVKVTNGAVLDAVGNVTSHAGIEYTYYDVLGRTIGTARMAPSSVEQKSAVTALRLDAWGNVVFRIEYFNPLTSQPSTTNMPSVTANAQKDRITATTYDIAGHATQVIDAERKTIRHSYDQFGRVAKTWRTVTNNAFNQPETETAFELYRYDELGRLVEVEKPGNRDILSGVTVPRVVQLSKYNGFGELLERQSNGTRTEFTKYDNAGRAWLTTTGGVTQVNLHDAQGNVTTQLRSTAKEDAPLLPNLKQAQDALAAPNMLRTDMRYNLLGHMVDARNAGDDRIHMLERRADGSWLPALAGSQTQSGGLVILDSRANQGWTYRVEYARDGGAWTDAGGRISRVDGYPVFNTTGLPSGRYSYRVTAQPKDEAAFGLSSGALEINSSASDVSLERILQLHLTILGRTPDVQGLDYYMGRANQGATMEQIAVEMLESAEAVAFYGPAKPDNYESMMVKLFERSFGQPLSTDSAYRKELITWTARMGQTSLYSNDLRGQALVDLCESRRNALSFKVDVIYRYMVLNGGTNRDVLQDMLNRLGNAPDKMAELMPAIIEEARRKAESERAGLQLARAFVAILGRAADHASYNYWMGEINAGRETLTSATAKLLASPESVALAPVNPLDIQTYNLQLVQRVLGNLLSRVPTSAETDKWINQLNSGTLGVGAFALAAGEFLATDASVARTDRQLIFSKTSLSHAYAALIPPNQDTATQLSVARVLMGAASGDVTVKATADRIRLVLEAQATAAGASIGAATLAAGNWPLEQKRMMLARMYVLLHNRAPDNASFNLWLNALGSDPAVTPQSIAQIFLNHTTSDYPPTLSHADYVRKLWSTAVGGAYLLPPAQLDGWVARLDAGSANRATVALELIDWLVGGTSSAHAPARTLFDNKAAVGLTYALNMQGNDVALARAMLAKVTATDMSEALSMAYQPTADVIRAIAEQHAAAAREAATLMNDAAEVAQEVATAAIEVRNANAALAGNQMAAPYLRATRLYVAVLNRGPQGKFGLDVTGLTNMARTLQGANRAAEIAMVQSMLDSAEGSAVFPSAGFTPDGFIRQLYLHLTGKQAPAALLEQWGPRVTTPGARAQMVLDFLDTFIAPSVTALPPDATVPDGLITFHQQVAEALSGVKAEANNRAANANQALATATDAQYKANALANAESAYAQAVAGASGTHGVNALNIARLVVGLLGYNVAPQNVFNDFNGFMFWIRGASQGDSMRHIAERFLADNPAKFPPGQSNASFLNQLCLQVLGRPSLPTDNTFWLDALNSGLSRGRIAWDFIDSLINRPNQLVEEFNYRAAFEQRVYDAVSAFSGAPTSAGIAAAQRALDNAWSSRQSAINAQSQASSNLTYANNLTTATYPDVVAAQGAVNFQASGKRTELQKVLVGFYQPTDYHSTRAVLAELDAGRTTYADILRPLVGTMANKREFYSDLYRKVLLREPEEGGLNGWLANQTYTDPGVAAYAFFVGAQDELTGGLSPGRKTFNSELQAVVSSHQSIAQPLASGYNQAVQTANAQIPLLRSQALTAYNQAISNYQAADLAWQNAHSLNEVAKVTNTTNSRMLAMASASVTVSNAAIDRINSAAKARTAAIALDPTAGTWTLAQTIAYTKPYVEGSNSIPGNINLSNAMAGLAAANIALMLEKLDLASAAEATRRLATVVQVYLVVLNREPTLFELNAALQSLPPANCPPADLERAYCGIASSLIADNPQAYASGMSNFDFVARIYRNATNKVITSVDAGVQFWLDALTRTENRYSRGDLAYGMVYSLVTGTINDDSVTFNNKTATALRNVDFATRTATVSSDISGFVASLSRMLAAKASSAGAAADAALTPAARYAIEATQVYLALLGRTPEPTALANIIAQRSTGVPLSQITQAILQSAEIQPLLPSSLGNAGFVDSLVRHMLGREPDAADRNELLGKLGSGLMSRARLVEYLIASTLSYADGDPVKAAARTRFMGRLTTGLDTMAAGLATLAGDLVKTNIASLSSLLALKLLDYTDGIDQGLASQVSSGKVVLRQLDRYTIDRWGNIVTALDLRDPNWVTTYTYNASNQVVKVAQTGTPTAKALYNQTTYDKLGRVLTTTEGADAAVANSGHKTSYKYDGNGYLMEEVRADGGKTTYTLDVFGQRTTVTQLTNSVNSSQIVTNYTYDRLGRQTSRTSAPVSIYYWDGYAKSDQSQAGKTITDTYMYDELGRRTMATNSNNSTLADPNKTTSTRMRYDLSGNLIESVDAANNSVKRVYDQYNNKKLEKNSTGTMGWENDQHGRIKHHTDLAGNHWSYTYNEAGQLTETTGTAQEWDSATSSYQQRTQVVRHNYDSHTGHLLQTTESVAKETGGVETVRKISRFSYDAAGQRIAESVWVADAAGGGGRMVQNQVLKYDQYGRMTSITSAIAGADYKVNYIYDDFGNREKVTTSYTSDNGNRKNIIVNYKYDAMNRVVEIKGSTETLYGVPVAEYLNPYKPHSKDYEDISDETEVVWKEFDNKNLEHRIISYDWLGNRISESTNGVMENYRYDTLGRLSEIRNAANDLVGHRHYDGMGRVISSWDKDELRLSDYNEAGRLDLQHTLTKSNENIRSKVAYNYRADGALASYTVTDAYDKRQTTTHEYALKRDSLLLTKTTVQNVGSAATKTSSMFYDINSNMVEVTGEDARTMVYDGAGHVMEKLQDGVLTHTLIANSEMIGSSNNAFETFSSVYESVTAPAMSDVGVYVVQSKGETLQSIAKALWGDARLWYMIAEANGLTDDIALAVGQQLKIPQRATAIHNSAETFKPYNSSEIIGRTTPELAMPPPPPQKGGCGAVTLLVTLGVAIALSVFMPGAGTFLGKVAIGAISSTAGQAAGVATGEQDRINWKGVKLAAISAGAAYGVESIFNPAVAAAGSATPGALGSSAVGLAPAAEAGILSGSGWQAVAGRAMVANIVTQSVANITGLQNGFKWQAVAAAGLGAAAGSWLNTNLPKDGIFGNAIARSATAGFGAGLTAAVARGGKIVVQQIALDAFGNALGSSLADQLDSERALNAAHERSTARAKARGDSMPLLQATSLNTIPTLRPEEVTLTHVNLISSAEAVLDSSATWEKWREEALRDSLNDPHSLTAGPAGIRPNTVKPMELVKRANAMAYLPQGAEINARDLKSLYAQIRGAQSSTQTNEAEHAYLTSALRSLHQRGVNEKIFGVEITEQMARDIAFAPNGGGVKLPPPHASTVLPRTNSGHVPYVAPRLQSGDPLDSTFVGPPAPPSRAAIVQANNAAGEAWAVDVVTNILPLTQINIQREITIRSLGPSGMKTRLDAVGTDIISGSISLSEMKASLTAPLTVNQKIVHPELGIYGGVVVGAGKAPYVGGTRIPPTPVDVLRKP